MTIPIKQVVAHWCLPHHSALDLPANSILSQLSKSSQWNGGSLNFLSLPSPMAENWLTDYCFLQKIMPHTLLLFAQTIVNSKNHCMFPLFHVTARQHFPLCLKQVSIMLCLLGMKLSKLFIRSALPVDFFNFWAKFGRCTLYLEVPCT